MIFKSKGSEKEIKNFSDYKIWIIHQWSTTLSFLAISLVPAFFILDMFLVPKENLYVFGMYRIVATVISIIIFAFVRFSTPSKLSYSFGYVVTLVVGGVIALMTRSLGGYSSAYYAGLNLVIIGVNLLLPWGAFHSGLNGLMIVVFYVLLCTVGMEDIDVTSAINNLFFTSATVFISVIINHVRLKLIKDEYLLRQEMKKTRDALWGEMEIAKRIQTSLLPSESSLADYNVVTFMKPADEVGGDYYDFFTTRKGEHWLAIGDVSGHGVEAGLMMMMTQTSVFTAVNENDGLTPSQVLSITNETIFKNITRLGISKFMTIFAIRFDGDKMTVAGSHLDIIVYRAKNKTIEYIDISGTWIGLIDDISEHLKDYEFIINKGDMILLYTDGLTEASNEQGELYGERRVGELLREHVHLSEDDIIKTLIDDINSFQHKQDDDHTVVLLKKQS